MYFRAMRLILSDRVTYKLLSIAMILDPCFSAKFFTSNITKANVKEMLHKELQKIVDEENSLVS